MLEDLRLEDVDTGVDGVAERLFDFWFLLKTGDAVIGIGHDDPVAAHLFPWHPLGHEAGDGALLTVATNRFTQIEVDQRIAAQHNEGVIEELLEVLNFFQATGGTEGITDEFTVLNAAFKAVSDFNSKTLPVPKVVFDFFSQVRDIHHHFGEAMLLEQLQQKLHHRLLQDGNHRFWDHMGDRLDPCPFSCRQDHRLHRRFWA